MRHFIFIFLLFMLTSMVRAEYLAEVINYEMIDGIYYEFSGNKAIVTCKRSELYRYEYVSGNISGYWVHYSDYSGNVIIPESVTYNGKDYKVTGISGWAFYNCSSLTSITIPEGVTYIGHQCFDKCSNLKGITLPSTLEKIEELAFNNCEAIETIYSNITRVFSLPTYKPPFEQIVYDNAILYVPVGTKTKYQQIQGWKKFLNIRENTADITISNAGYSTFYNSQFSYVLPNGLSAQVVTKAFNGKLIYKTIADGNTAGIVPKGTAVILASQGGRVGIYTLTPTLNNTSYSGTNLLQGSDEITTTTGNGYHYKLSYGKTGTVWDNVFGWYWGAQDGSPFQIEGHKAWLVVPSGSTRAEAFTIDGDATEITDIEPDKSSDVYYDIQGRRVSTPTRSGLYIKNDKKIIIK